MPDRHVPQRREGIDVLLALNVGEDRALPAGIDHRIAVVGDVELRVDNVVDIELAKPGDLVLVQMLTCISAVHSTEYTARAGPGNGAFGPRKR